MTLWTSRKIDTTNWIEHMCRVTEGTGTDQSISLITNYVSENDKDLIELYRELVGKWRSKKLGASKEGGHGFEMTFDFWVEQLLTGDNLKRYGNYKEFGGDALVWMRKDDIGPYNDKTSRLGTTRDNILEGHRTSPDRMTDEVRQRVSQSLTGYKHQGKRRSPSFVTEEHRNNLRLAQLEFRKRETEEERSARLKKAWETRRKNKERRVTVT
jgi:hypothetical protein